MAETQQSSVERETEIVWNRLRATSDEMIEVGARLAFSLSMREWADIATAIMTPQGGAISMSDRSVPVLCGGLSRTTRIVLEDHFPPNSLDEGDIVILNDPWIGGGHLHDFVLLTPVFADGELVAIAGSLGHVGDVGGLMGGWSTDAQQYYEEGITIPPVKFYEKGEINSSIEEIIRGNVRMPDEVIGDLEALRSANEVGAERVREIIEEQGAEGFVGISDEINSRSENALRDKIRTLEDGSFSNTVPLTLDKFDLEISLTVTIDGSDINIDFTGTSDQVNGGINCPIGNTRAVTAYVIKCMMIPDIGYVEGIFNPITVDAPEGSIVNPDRPAATDGRHITYVRVEDCLIGALAEVLPDKVVSESALMQLINLSGTDENGNPFVTVNSTIGPFPARAHKDGESAVLFPSNAAVSPIEIFEQYCPLRIRRSELVKDTEGPGEHISGFAHGVSFYNPTENVIDVSLTSSKDRKAPLGVQGGEPGTRAAARFPDSDKEAPTSGRTEIRPSETFIVHSATPGGYGNPEDRDSKTVMRDYTLDLISERRCRDTYGVDPSKQAD